MPEGDILRRTADRFELAIGGRVLVRSDLRWPTAATVDLVGRTVLETRSYGKHLLTRFDDGRTLHTHLRMEGYWRIARTGSPEAAARSPQVRAVLATEEWTTVGYHLGMLDVVRTRDERTLIGHLGPDLLGETVDLDEALRRWTARGSTPVAEVLLDQTVVAGIGTIFAAESLFAERLWPWTPADAVADPAQLLGVARRQLQRSVADGRPPGHVHGRLRQPCHRCGTRIAVGQARKPPMERPIFYCPRCQQEPAGG
ncbi:DNA-formamidopyrimidine glycosylase family protein [Cellulomonas humilata]|uniref:DNA-(apurinic or apyrimidinic site) lyase n=1 Tax=Cellulomonas humilata TaxID=144055 RepID=A0ABU0EGG8_9CELL|nr:DNA-formamidopyrimidine glycosylase family protein [Cellulomonas humilata]MDQ0374371.1 endonuclease-8 [Cellulomonas humilata]